MQEEQGQEEEEEEEEEMEGLAVYNYLNSGKAVQN